MSKCQESKTTLVIFGRMLYCLLLLLYSYFLNLVSYPTLGLELITHFVGMHVHMDQRIIMETQTNINPLNKVIQLNSQLSNYTHNLRWQRNLLPSITNGEVAHGKHDFDSIVQPCIFCPMNYISFQGPHLDSIGFRLHHHINI